MKRKFRITIMQIILVMFFSITSFAANTTVNNTTNNSVTSSTTNSSTKQTSKSSNANLSNLGIVPNDFSGFKESKTEYEVSVPNNITEVEVYATKKDNKATLTGTGKVKLAEGENKAEVVVTAEDGTKKTYTIKIKRLKVGEKGTTTGAKSDLSLESLEVVGHNLEPNFNQSTYQYTINYEGNDNALEIVAKANKTDATVKVIGNEKLINGKNLVTILVTDSKENNVATYQIYINKNLVEQNELMKQLEEAETEYQIKLWIVRILIIIIAICIIALLIVIYKKTNSKEYKKAKAEKKLYEIYKKERQKGKKEIEEKERRKKDSERQKETKHKRKH